MSIRPVVGVTRVVLVCGLFLVLAWSSVPSAQDRRLLDPNGYVRDDAYARPLVPAADQKYLKIDGLKMKDTLKEVVAISLKSRDEGKVTYYSLRGPFAAELIQHALTRAVPKPGTRGAVGEAHVDVKSNKP